MTDSDNPINWPYKPRKCLGPCGKELFVLPGHVPICNEDWDRRKEWMGKRCVLDD